MSEPERGRHGNISVNLLRQAGKPDVLTYWFWCPGCESLHRYEADRWQFNGNFDRPTFTPSLLMNGNQQLHNPTAPRCHLFMTDGKLIFLSDCTHQLAGKTVDIPPLPEWF